MIAKKLAPLSVVLSIRMLRQISLVLFLALGASVWAEEPAVQLLLPSRKLELRSTFEVRFAAEMVPADRIGKPSDVSPLVFEPPLEGRFVWLSTRSGTFAPARPLPLGTKFKISLRPALKDRAGNLLKAKLLETAETPPMRVKGVHAIGHIDVENAPIVPRLLVLFNANVKAAAAAKFCRFEDASGNRIAARVEQANEPGKSERTFPSWESDDRTLSAWSAQSEPEAKTETEDSESEETVDEGATKKAVAGRENILFIAPVKPLPSGQDWRLVLDAGIPAAEWRTTLPQRKEIKIGTVKPFAVQEVAAEGNRIAGRRVLIEFSKALSPEVTSETIGRWIKVEPAPKNLRAAVEDVHVTLRGDFSLGVKYRVVIAAGLPASQPTAMASAFSKEVIFEKYESRLYFQDFAAHQYLRWHAPAAASFGERSAGAGLREIVHRRSRRGRGESFRQIRGGAGRLTGRKLQSHRRRGAAGKGDLGEGVRARRRGGQ